ncbi:MAG: hypothetical protein RLY16_3049 [Bacteroidota bacterium]
MASYLHRTAQPFTLATFRSWGSSTGAGRIRLAGAKIGECNLKRKRIRKEFQFLFFQGKDGIKN